MKVAIVHDWLVTNAGAEKVLKQICLIYPNADIYTLVDHLTNVQRAEILNGKFPITSFIQKLPFSKKLFRNYLILFPKAIESFNLSDYDLIISSSWAVAKGIKKNTAQLHISYCHTPIRYAWDLYDEYTSQFGFFKRLLFTYTLKKIRHWDLKTVSNVDYFIANSKFVQERIQRIYNRESIVIYPPVDVIQYTFYKDKEDFYLTASRLVGYKKTKLIVEAFNSMPSKKLVVIGCGEEFDAIKKIAKRNIEVLGFQEHKVLKEKMQKAKAFIYAAIEDFGIVPIEAMSCGTPVISLNKGGTAETVKNGFNGIHFENQTEEDIINAIKRFEKQSFDYEMISKDSQNYSSVRFQEEMQKFLNEKRNYTK